MIEQTEAEWQAEVIRYAVMFGWWWYHPPANITRRGRSGQGYKQNTVPGYPDLTLVRERVVWVELKTERGVVSDAQRAWHDRLRAAGQEVHVWRPSQLQEVLAVLARV